MSETGHVQRLIVPGLLSVFFVLGSGSGARDALAAGLLQSTSTLALSRISLAQAAGEQDGPTTEGAAAGDSELVEGDVPFSELNEALSAARSRLAELTKAADIAKVAGDLQEKLKASEAENRQLKAVLSQLQTDNNGLLSARQASDDQIVELGQLAEEAAAEARRLDEELAVMRQQNSELSTSLAQAELVQREAGDDLENVRADLNARVDALSAAADESAGEITRLQRELDAAREQVLVAERQQSEGGAELAEVRQTADEAVADSARLARDLDSTITELAQARTELAAMQGAFEESTIAVRSFEEENGVLREQLAGSRSETDQLRSRLEIVENDVERVRTQNAGLEQQVGVLKAAAGEATNAARQNLLAVEDQINEINAAFASVSAEELLTGSGALESEGEDVGSSEAGQPPSPPAAGAAAQVAASNGWVPRPSPRRAEVQQELIATAAASETELVSTPPPSPLAGTDNQPLARDDGGIPETADNDPEIESASLQPSSPADPDAEALLEELKAERNELGLSMTVPGELLFAVNSEQIEPAAFDALANVAKLVDIYEGKPILIVGHTDAVGDAGYNQQLSERRAALVKQYFVENFEISADRLQIEGKGELNPITSNATADGRNTNRRVEVVILE